MAPPHAVVKRHCRQSSLLVSFLVFLCASCNVSAAVQHKVGDLDAWGVPPSSKPEVYSIWSQSRNFEIGDSLMFLYPPSQDAVLQVTEMAFESCDVGNPILRISDGNSLFNITSPGELFFTSSVPGRCEKKQKLRISVLGDNGGSSSPAAGSLPVVFAPAQPPSFAPPAATGIANAAASLLVLLLFQFLQP